MLNWDKTVYMLFDIEDITFDLNLDSTKIKKVSSTTFVRVELQNNLKWENHVAKTAKCLNRGLFVIPKV